MNHQDLYSRIAHVYDFSLFSFFRYKQKAHYFLQSLPFSSTHPIQMLDAGCGTGLFSLACLERFPNVSVTAFDLNPTMVRIFQRKIDKIKKRNPKLSLKIFQHNILDELKSNEMYDLIVTSGVLEHTPAITAVNNLVQHLKPGGYFLNCAVHDSPMGRFTGRLYGFTPYSLARNKTILAKAGLTDIKALPLPRKYFPLRTVRIGVFGRKPLTIG